MTDRSESGPGPVEQSKESLGDDAPEYGDADSPAGPLMAEIPEGEAGRAAQKKIAKLALKIWESKDRMMGRVEAQWKVNAARRMGISNAKVLWNDIDEHWTGWLPRNASPDVTPDVNKAAALCRRFVALMFADPPAPEVVPPSGEDDDIASAEFSERALVDLQGETGLNEVDKARRAFDRGSTFGSGWVRYWIDARGGGKVPVEIQARADATSADAPLIDPATVQMGTDEMGQPIPIPGSGVEQGPYVSRYATPDGQLTDDKTQAATRWAPAIKSEVLDGRHVRLIPHTADDIWDAHGAQVVSFVPWGELKQMAPDLAKVAAADKKAMLSYRPDRADDLMPGGKDADEQGSDKNEDETLVFVLTTYYKACEEYQEALYLITIGDQFVLHRSAWADPQTNEPLDIPITQYAQWAEGRDGYWRVGMMELVGGGNELRAAQIAGLLDHLEWFNNRKTFFPTNSVVTPEQMATGARYISMNPGGKPEVEDVPPYPIDSYNALEIIGKDMDNASGLQEAGANGTNDADVKSGRQAYAIISQVHAGLSEPRANIERGFTRGSRIALQLARAFFDVPRQLKWNEDGKYRQKAWTKADLTNSTDVRVKPGTMTMLSPAGKAQLYEHWAQLGLIPPDELRELLTSSIAVGMEDDPFRMRIRNQIAEWQEGPPENWQPMAPQLPHDPMTGMPVPPPVDPAVAKIFEPVPCDLLPGIAQIRVTEMAKAMAGRRYLRWPPEWRAGLDAEYARMTMAAQPPVPMPAPGQDGKQQSAGPPNLKPRPENDLRNDAMREGVPPDMVAA